MYTHIDKSRIGLRLDFPGGDGYREVFPFRKSWIAIAVVFILDLIFGGIAVKTFIDTAGEWGKIEDLFDLTTALFTSAWLLGWSFAPAILTLILFLMLFGREVVRAYGDTLEIGLGIPGLVLAMRFDVDRMSNLRLEEPSSNSGKSWRGPHMVFDYGGGVIEFGSAINAAQMVNVKQQIQEATGRVIANRRLHSHSRRQAGQIDSAPEPITEETFIEAKEDNEPLTLASPSTIMLMLANLAPIFGALFFEWKLSDVMIIYWAESAVIGIYNICKIAVANGWMVLIAGPFFLAHFGAFMSIHFLFIYGIFIEGMQSGSGGGELAGVAQLFIDLWPALVMLFISHGVSFFYNFIGRKEYKGRTLEQLMKGPYGRIIFMHLVIIFGGGLTMILGSPTIVLLIAIALKIVIDVRSHLKEHNIRVE